MSNIIEELFFNPKKSQQNVAETGTPKPEMKIERMIIVTYIDKTIPQGVFNDVDEFSYEDIWTRIRLKNKKLVVISSNQILRMDSEWTTREI